RRPQTTPPQPHRLLLRGGDPPAAPMHTMPHSPPARVGPVRAHRKYTTAPDTPPATQFPRPTRVAPPPPKFPPTSQTLPEAPTSRQMAQSRAAPTRPSIRHHQTRTPRNPPSTRRARIRIRMPCKGFKCILDTCKEDLRNLRDFF